LFISNYSYAQSDDNSGKSYTASNGIIYHEGAINQDEYDAKKKAILSR
jgi:hypothetical protein